jgi:hypothetical protein
MAMSFNDGGYDQPRTIRHSLAVSGAGWRLRDGRLVIAFVILSGPAEAGCTYLQPIAVLNDGTEVSLSATPKVYPTNWQFPDAPDLPPLPPSRLRRRTGHAGRTGI